MKFIFPIVAWSLFSVAPAFGQVASHAPVLAAPPSTPTAANAQSSTARPVARVNGTVLTEGDLLREEYTIFPYGRQHGGIPKEMEPGIRSGAMQMMIFEELVYQEARRRQMTIPAPAMEKAEAQFRKQFRTPADFNAFLANDFQNSLPLVRQKIRRSLLIDALLKVEVEDKCKPTPAELKKAYDEDPARFDHAESFTFQTISIIPPANATAAQLQDARTRAGEALKQARATKTEEQFGLLAEKISEDDYRVMMGKHKPVEVTNLPPDVVSALRTLKAGEVSDVLQVGNIFTIVRPIAHTAAGKDSFETARPGLEKQLTETRRGQLRAALDSKLRQNAKIEKL